MVVVTGVLYGTTRRSSHPVEFNPLPAGRNRNSSLSSPQLLSSAALFLRAAPTPPTPFTVAVIDLVGGPVVKAIVEGDDAAVGSSVEGFLVPEDQDDVGNVIVDLRFRVIQ